MLPRQNSSPRVRATSRCWAIACLLTALSCGLASTALAQIVPEYGRYQLLPRNAPPGLAARWADLTGKADPNYFQPIRVINEQDGDVTFFHGRPVQPVEHQSPAQLSVIVGHSYRFKLSNMKQFPGIELFPTIEVIDRIHPPTGQKHHFPIPLHISRSDIEAALKGRLVTRVIYLEQPQLAAPFELDESTRTRRLKPRDHAFEMADRLGRPMIILRMGGRTPSPRGEPAAFWGTGGPVGKSVAPKVPAKPETPIEQPAPTETPAGTNSAARSRRSPAGKRTPTTLRTTVPSFGRPIK